jgi:hypothetical protein
MYRLIFLTLPLTFIFILPATAQLGKVWTDFQSYSVDLQNYLKTNLRETLQPIDSQAESAIYNATGDLNIPNPIAAGQGFRDQDKIMFNPPSDKFENNSTVRSALVSNEINRLITRGAIESELGVNEQTRLKTKLMTTQKTIENIEALTNSANQNGQQFLNNIASAAGNAASNLFIPQLSQLLNTNQLQTMQIQQQQSELMAESFLQNIQMNHTLQYSNLNLANISQQMDEANRARRVDDSAEAARLLRTTSQMDLFGKKPKN